MDNDIGEEWRAHREFLLSALRTASMRCKTMDNDITTIGIALKADLIGPDTAVQWLIDGGLMFLVAPLPDRVGQIAKANISTAGEKDADVTG